MELVDLTTVISTLIAQAPLVALLALTLLLYMERRFHGVELAIRDLRRSVDGLVSFNEILLYTLHGRGAIGDVEFRVLQALLGYARPQAYSKYYTEEVARRLDELLKIDIDQYTWDHVFELERIADLMMREARESDRDDLARYAGRLRAFIVLLQARLISKGIMPPRRLNP